MKKIFLLIIPITLVLTAYSQITNGEAFSIDSSKYTILNFDKAKMDFFGNKYIDYKGTVLTEDELLAVQNLIIEAISNNNVKQKELLQKAKEKEPNKEYLHFLYPIIDDLNTYRFQLIPIISNKNEKVVGVNAFCKDSYSYNSSWKKQMVSVEGGGKCYFNLKINLFDKKYYELYINGPK